MLLEQAGEGEFVIKRKPLAAVPPFSIVFIVNLFVPLRGLEGFALLIMIPVTLVGAKFLFNKGLIVVVRNEKKAESTG